MTLISLINASKDFGIHTLFKELNLHIQEKERLGLIGANGAGKSTLLKIIAGIEPLSSGERRSSSRMRHEIVNQQCDVVHGRSVLEEVLAGCGEKRELILRFNKLSDEVAKKPKDRNLLNVLGHLSEKMDYAEAWNLEQECKEVLQRLGLKDINAPVQTLSGGYRKRVALASALISKPDLLLLDEPTNHLDASAVEWLQSWLAKYPGALVLTTHDRYVLDEVTEQMIEIDKGKAITYQGNYSTFLQQKAKSQSLEITSDKKFKGILRRELAWLRQGAKARSTKQKARLQRIKRMQSEISKDSGRKLEMSTASRRIGKLVINAENLGVTIDSKPDSPILFEQFTYEFGAEDRVGIIGSNGSGKSTLLDLIAGQRKPTLGKLVIGETVHIAYLDQYAKALLNDPGLGKKVIDFVEETATLIKLKNKEISASQLLERFLFSPSQQHAPIKRLSGGERRRLTLCRLLIQAPNVLLFDEPTNDLDLQTLRVLEEFLEDYQGCVVIASHDRYFLDRTVDRIFNFEEKRLKRYEGNYSSFLEKKKLQEKNTSIDNYSQSRQPTNLKKKHKQNTRRRSFKESKELEELDQKLPILESKKNSLEKELNQGTGDLISLSKELASLLQNLQIAEDRWLELSDLEN